MAAGTGRHSRWFPSLVLVLTDPDSRPNSDARWPRVTHRLKHCHWGHPLSPTPLAPHATRGDPHTLTVQQSVSPHQHKEGGREAGCRGSPSAHAAPVIYYQQQRREHRAVVAHAPSMCAIAYHSQPLPRSDCRMLQSPMRSLLPVRHHLPPNHATQARQYPRLARPVAAPAGHTCERHPLT